MQRGRREGPHLAAAIALVTPTLAHCPSSPSRFNQVLNTSIVAHLERIPSTSRERYPEIEKEREEEKERGGMLFSLLRLLPRSSLLSRSLSAPSSQRRVKRLRASRIIATVDGVEHSEDRE